MSIITILYPTVYRVENLNKEEIGNCTSLVEAVKLARDKKGYQYANFVNIFAIYADDLKELVPKHLYSSQKYNLYNNRFKYIWMRTLALQIAEKKIFREITPKERTCFKCGRNLDFDEFCETNKWLKRERASELWDHPYIELFCCSCFRIIRTQQARESFHQANPAPPRPEQEETQRTRRRVFRHLISRFEILEQTDLMPTERRKIERLEEEIGIQIPVVEKVDQDYHTLNFGYIPKDGEIIGLSLYYCGLRQVPETIKSFSHLEYLDLSGNRIEVIPEWLGTFHNLKYLKLLANKISSVPHSLTSLESLECLDLSGNQLGTLPEFIMRAPSLKYLHLWANNFNIIPNLLGPIGSEDLNIII